MKSGYAVLAMVGVTLISACSDEATSPRVAPADRVLATRAPSIPVIPLAVTISNADGAGNAYNIRNDGQGAYLDAVDGVEARLDAYGTFAFNMGGRRTRPSVRWVTYIFDNPVDPTNLYRPTPDNTGSYHFSTGTSKFSPSIPIQNLGVNGNPVSQCMYMGNHLGNSSTTWRVSFHKGYEDVSDSPTAFAVVTRTSVNPAVWTVAPAGSCSPNSNVAVLRSDDGSVLHGYYSIPFHFTLTPK